MNTCISIFLSHWELKIIRGSPMHSSQNYSVSQDTAYFKKGNPIGMAELMIKADDMAKVGLLVLHKGSWNGKQIIAESWFDESMNPGQDSNRTCGLLWWLLYNPATSYVNI